MWATRHQFHPPQRGSAPPNPRPSAQQLALTYIFFGGWGDFFHLFLSYFPGNLGIFLEISLFFSKFF